jgi:hypothetical protein
MSTICPSEDRRDTALAKGSDRLFRTTQAISSVFAYDTDAGSCLIFLGFQGQLAYKKVDPGLCGRSCADIRSVHEAAQAARTLTVTRRGLVPDAETAVKVALAVLPHMGSTAEREIGEYRPWHAEPVGDAWQVRGTLPAGTVGGTFVVVVAKSDARIIGVSHEQ